MQKSYFRHLKVVWAAIEVFCFSGITYGWSSLVLIFKEEGMHAELCTNNISTTNKSYAVGQTTRSLETVDCTDQDLRFNLYFTIPVSLSYLLVFLGSHVLARFGIRVARLMAGVLLWAGFTLLGFSNNDTPWLIIPGILFVMSGGLQLMITSTQLSNLYEAGKVFVVSLLTGLIGSSSCMVIFIKLAHDSGIARWSSFTVLLVAAFISISASTFIIYPRYFMQKNQEVEINVRNEPNSKDNALQLEQLKTEQLEKSSVLVYILSPVFLLHFLWFAVGFLHFNFFFGAVNKHLIKLMKGNTQEVSYFTDVFYYIQTTGVILSMTSGVIYEVAKKRCKAKISPLKSKLLPPLVPMVIGSTAQVLMPILMMVDNSFVQYVLFVDVLIIRTFLFATGVAFLVDIFPLVHFGVMYTLILLSAAMVNLSNYGLFYWAVNYHNGWFQVNVLQVCLATIGLMHPFIAWLCCQGSSIKDVSSSWKKIYLGGLFSEEFVCGKKSGVIKAVVNLENVLHAKL